MRKVLKSKRETCSSCDNTYKKWKYQAKRYTIPSSNWCTRNDSSRVSAILQPSNYLSPKKLENSSKVEKICLCLSTNTCYCREKKKIKPSLFSKPNSCIILKEIESKIPEDDLKRSSLQCLCESDDFVDSLEIAKKLEENKKYADKSTNVEYTEQRNKYEKYRKEREGEDLKEVEEFEAQGSETDPTEDKVSTILGTKHEDTNTLTSSKSSDSLKSLEDLDNFRRKHYFETHSTEKLFDTKSSETHTCLHQFRLDDRFLPLPINKDVFGRSLCSVCSKPMEGSSMQLSKGYFSQKPTMTILNNYSRSQDYGLMPRTINIGGKKSEIEVKLGENDVGKFGKFLGKFKKAEHCNSLALRQQKMRAY